MIFEGIGHLDSENLTWKDVNVPTFVPLVVDFNEDNEVGVAQLEWLPAKTIVVENGTIDVPGALKVIVEIPPRPGDSRIFPKDTPLAAAVMDGVRSFDAETLTAYLTGGTVSNVSLLTPSAQTAIIDADEKGDV